MCLFKAYTNLGQLWSSYLILIGYKIHIVKESTVTQD